MGDGEVMRRATCCCWKGEGSSHGANLTARAMSCSGGSWGARWGMGEEDHHAAAGQDGQADEGEEAQRVDRRVAYVCDVA